MTEAQFLKAVDSLIYKENTKNLNQLFKLNKTASLALGVFLKVPMVFSTKQTDMPFKTLADYRETNFSAHVIMDKSINIHMDINYPTPKDMGKVLKLIEKHSIFFTFVMLHELSHIMRKHNTTAYENMMLRYIPKNVVNKHELTNIAQDYAINYTLKDIFQQSIFKNEWPLIGSLVLYNSEYHKAKMSDVEILKELLKAPPQIQYGDSGTFTTDGTTVDADTGAQPSEGSSATQPMSAGEQDSLVSNLSESLKETFKSSTKGNGSSSSVDELFGSVAIDVSWFKKIKGAFKRQVYYMTHDYSTTWTNLNNVYRHIAKFPKKIFYDYKIELILSIDQSGSMSTEDLQKLLYLMEQSSKQISKLTILIHTTAVDHEFIIEDDYDLTSNPDFKVLSTRMVSGGTSHKAVFERIQEMRPDPTKSIYLSFSDNYSDIESEYFNYPIMKQISCFWVCAGADNPVSTPGTNIIIP
jgi:hypothetical protein